MSCDRGRGRGFHGSGPGRSGGRSAPSGQHHYRRRDHEPGLSSRGREQIYVEKRRDGQNSSQPVTGISPEAKSSIALDQEPARSSHGRETRLKWVEKRQEGQNSSEPVTSISSKAKSSIDIDSAREEVNSPSFSTPCEPLSGERIRIKQDPEDVSADNGTLSCNLSAFDISQNCSGTTTTPFKNGEKVSVTSPITGPETPASDGKSNNSHQAFDICPKKPGVPNLNASLLHRNRAIRNENKRNTEPRNQNELRPGMVLLKGYISSSDQVKIVKQCRDLGIGPGGFYQPGYRDGTQLHLNMMCLGKNWDPQSRSYSDHRPSDGAKPPLIPSEFFELVKKAIEDSHSVIEEKVGPGKAETRLPRMKPNICIVNFYSTNGRLGLHQDRDESQESLRKRLPVVSFSIGDSAEFLYGDERDVDKANKVVLESGDVLIFGGDSRHVFHGVTSIEPNTAPKTLLEETHLRAGRLNLTFRQY